MTDIIDLNAKRAPVVYTIVIAHHYDGTLEFNIEGVADDERSREAVLHAFRRISGADEEIEKLTVDLKQAIYSDSEYCEVVSAENSDLRARIAELEDDNRTLREALKPFADEAQTHSDKMPDYMKIDDYAGDGCKTNLTIGDLRAARAARAALKGETK